MQGFEREFLQTVSLQLLLHSLFHALDQEDFSKEGEIAINIEASMLPKKN